ncbi:MAG: 16S rRNA m(4)C1402 methyltransferase [Candidatus Westeberhardia cardiocondylae]|nr:16S rRNA m(4)C1402 methyltransferase [Candidatus Westeberhardia cardiocondylae]
MTNNTIQHIPVLLKETIHSLNIKKNGFYIDGTFGHGGHSKIILSKLSKYGKLLAIDRDIESIQIGLQINDSRFTILHGLFSNIKNYLIKKNLLRKTYGILLDLGLSSLQIQNPNRGFSFNKNGPLDMRMNTTYGKTAKIWINKAKKEEISIILKKYGEEKQFKKITKNIIKQRNKKPITQTKELTNIILKTKNYNKKYKKHPATKCFQAIRIFINDEILELKKILNNIFDILITGGRMSIISFHSLETQIIKKFIKKYTTKYLEIPKNIPLNENEIIKKYRNTKQIKIINIIKPSKNEIKKNPKSRSATLFTIEKTSL